MAPSLLFPGTMGGGNWGGVSFDPHLGYIFVNTSSLGGAGHMVAAEAGAPMPYRNEGGYTRFIDEDGYPCQQPPWGELTAINANTGDIAWRRRAGPERGQREHRKNRRSGGDIGAGLGRQRDRSYAQA
jgi:quinoprotein glucose dehydrogenase